MFSSEINLEYLFADLFSTEQFPGILRKTERPHLHVAHAADEVKRVPDCDRETSRAFDFEFCRLHRQLVPADGGGGPVSDRWRVVAGAANNCTPWPTAE